MTNRCRQRLIELKIYRRRRRHKKRTPSRKNSEFKTIASPKRYFSSFLSRLADSGYIDAEFRDNHIRVPNSFTLTTNYDECLSFFKKFISSYIYGKGAITLDFGRCKKSNLSSFAVLEIVIFYLEEFKERYNSNRYTLCDKKIKIINSKKDSKTNKYICAFLGVPLPEKHNDGSQYLRFHLQRGIQSTYSHNSKARICSDVVEFVNKSTHEVGVELNPRGKSNLDKLLGEVLGNAEDHSARNSYWHVTGISFKEKQADVDVVELNLCIANIGESMYEGFEATKNENYITYNKCEELYSEHTKLFSNKRYFERENLFTLYLLNDGISRLKYKDPSRGNGTTRFLQSFIKLGQFGKTNKRFNSELIIASGHTTLKCDNNVGPFYNGTALSLSLNSEQDISLLPNPDYLQYYSSYFPGTLLEIHIFLNKDYFKKILNNENSRTNGNT